ncbi:hypothetical protein BH11PSE4_BH11PSE4_30500 [soil metagenome]
MNRFGKQAMAMAIALAIIECAGISAASARGGGSNFMNSPGYQRRLQESRGYVTDQSGSLFASPARAPAPAVRVRKHRHHHRH